MLQENMMTQNFGRHLLKANNMRVIDMEVASRRLQHTLHTVRHCSTKRYFRMLTTNFVAQEEEEEPVPSAPPGNQEHIIGTGGESETLDPSTNTPSSPSNF
jgi:hypothetical protein